ncbi:hypothetical protein [Dongia deserti]|nr:hypothetical protein [Dongia deserti]
MSDGIYSAANFRVRQAPRIFPALFFMCAVIVLFLPLFSSVPGR